MKIALTHTRYSYTGGVEKYIHSLVELLLGAGHEVHYFAARFEPREHARLRFHAVPWVRFPPSLRVLSFNWFLNRRLARERFDVVHGFTKTDRQDVYTDGSGLLEEFLDATLAHRPRWWRTFYRRTPHQLAILALERRRFRRDAIRKIVPMARFVREQILGRYPVDPERIEVIYNGVDTEHFHPRNRAALGGAFRRAHDLPADRPLLLFVGNDWLRKGLDTTLRALPGILATVVPRPCLAVAGRENHPRRYRQLARTLGVAEAVRWIGPLREIRDAFAAADLFVLPSRYDVFGNVGLEALASGVPALLSRRAGVSEVLDGGPAGAILEDPLSAAELARAAAEFLDPARLEERRRAARALAERYSWERHFARLLALYEEVAAEKRRDAASGALR